MTYNGAKMTQKLAEVLLGNCFYTNGYDDSPFRTAAYNGSKPPIEVMRECDKQLMGSGSKDGELQTLLAEVQIQASEVQI
jgi:hypothetical protein